MSERICGDREGTVALAEEKCIFSATGYHVGTGRGEVFCKGIG